jgi:hypothetical protein
MPIPPIAITTFGGEVPVMDDRLLPDNNATQAINSWLFQGRIEPLHTLTPLHTMANSASRSWFRMPKGAPSIDYMVDSYWLEFPNENVRVVRSPTPGQDDDGRFYWADGVYPKMMTGTMIETGAAPYQLGVPPPETAPTVTPSGGVSTVNETISYVYTWVTGAGEEGPPSPATTVTNKVDALYTIGLTAPLPADTANRNLTKTRIYRTVVSAQGVATFFFVAEIPIATLTYADDHNVMTDAKVVNNEQLQTITWAGPPVDLQGLVGMANGMLAGWRFNEVWFCEPYNPHAWPPAYVIAVEGNIVGLGVYNQSLIILTEGWPYSATGISPDNMTLAKIQPLEPCTSQRSIVNTPNGVLYSSPNGLINITPAGAVNLTIQLMTKDQWYGLLNLDTITATIISQGYYAYSGPIAGVFQSDTFQNVSNTPANPTFQIESHYGTRPGAYISLVDQRQGVVVLDPTPSEVINLVQDVYNGETMVLRDGIVYLVDLRTITPYARYRWRSKIFTLPYLQNLGAAKVYWTPAYTVPPTGPTYFRVFAGDHAQASDDGLPLRFEETMSTPGQMFRLPSGYKAQYYQFEVEGELVIEAIHCAQTAHELRRI